MDTFHIVALGQPGAGKTIYLAALQHALGGNEETLGAGITATVEEPIGRAHLRRIYKQVVNPEETRWPPPTGAGDPMREFTFKITVSWTQSRRFGRPLLRTYRVFDVSYVDYAGEWIPDPDLQSDIVFNEFQKRMNEAHSLLGVIDGLKLLQFMEGNPLGEEFLSEHLRPLVEFMEGTDKPIHFILTKWDLLKDKFSLADVSNRLLASGQAGFRSLIQSRTSYRGLARRPVGTVRLIPVSSVAGLAKLQEDWTVVKAGDGRVTPINVEMPLAAAVYDVCDFAAKQLRFETAQGLSGDAEKAEKVGTGGGRAGEAGGKGLRDQVPDVKVGVTGVSISLSQIVIFLADAGQEAVKLLGKPAVRAARSARRQVRRVQARGIMGVTSHEAALFYVAGRLKHRLRAFETGEPASVLHGAPSASTTPKPDGSR